MHTTRRGMSLVLPLVAVAAIGVSGAQAGSNPEANADLSAIHWKHEDALYGASQTGSQARATAVQLRAAHWKHEDALYRAADSTSGSQPSATTHAIASDGLGWSEAWSGAGGAAALIIVGAAATILIRRRHRPFTQS